ncbi:MAG TPA: extracellular solute-binding protein, partial [Fimbriimonas sp.]
MLLVFGAIVLAASVRAETVLRIWGVALGPDSKGTQAVVREFEKRNPGVRVSMLSMGTGHMNAQKLMTAIVGRVPPDLIYQGRFNISDYASRGAFRPLDDLIQRDLGDPTSPRREQYYAGAWDESVYEGKVYAIPTGADDRALYWNKKVFRERAKELRALGMDPNRAPRTWSELLLYTKALTIPGKRIGFIPNFGNSWFYMYAFENNANFLSPDGHTATLNTPEAREALDFMVKAYDLIGGYERVNAFQSTFQGGENDPFITGQVPMKIDGDWTMDGLARYGWNLDFGVAPPPVPDDRYYGRGRFAGEKDRFVSWMGGFSYAIPTGARNLELAWRFVKFATSYEGRMIENKAQASWQRMQGRMFIPRLQGNIQANEALFRIYRPVDRRFVDAMRTHMDLLPVSRTRPPTPAGQLLWDEHAKAMERAVLHTKTVEQALAEAEAVVQQELNRIYSRERHPIVNLWIPIALVLAVAAAGGGILWYRWTRLRLGRISRNEALWAYAFISPWVIGFLVFTIGPMLASMFLVFADYDVLSPPRWVGWGNFRELFTLDWTNWMKALSNVAYLGGIGVPLGIASGLAVALLLNAAVKGIRFYRTMFYMPAIVPGIASAVLWIWLLDPDPNRGLINTVWQATLTEWLSIPPPMWLGAEAWAKPALIVQGLWGAGAGMVLWLASLKGVPQTLYEAATVDGANPNQQFWTITMPMISPIVFFNLVMGLIGALQEFDRVYVMTGGLGNGPNDSLAVPVRHLFNHGFTYFHMGYASALAWVIFVL